MNAVTATIPVGRRPSGIAVGSRAVWVANAGDGTVFERKAGAFPKAHHAAARDGDALTPPAFPVAWPRSG